MESLSASAQVRRAAISWWLWFAGLIGITGVFGLWMLRDGPNLTHISWFCYLLCAAAIVYQPRYGVYLVVALTLAGDSVLMPWYPFVKNFSSLESPLFLNRSLIVSPIESYIVLTFVSWLGRAGMRRKLTLHTGPLFWPALIFIGFITIGLGYGVMTGGNSNIALWETRAIYYMPAMLVLTSNLIETRGQVNRLVWTVVIALFLDALNGDWFVATTLNFDIGSVESIAEHSASIHANSFFVLVIAAWMFRASRTKRVVLPIMTPFIALSYFANQRRAAFISLALALVLIGVVLYWEHRRAFWLLAPIVAVVGLVYLAAFWNSKNALGVPARAIRSMIASDPNDADAASNEYRVIENINTQFTIKLKPLTGVGFGNKFYIIAQMPDISFFEWWEYITHNSILWVWMKAGVGAFVSMIFLVALSVIVGARTVWRMPGGDMSAAALMATLYIIMHFVYAYVDMSWELQSMVYIGTMMGLLNCLEPVVAREVPVPPKRWPWQPEPARVPGLRPQ